MPLMSINGGGSLNGSSSYSADNDSREPAIMRVIAGMTFWDKQ